MKLQRLFILITAFHGPACQPCCERKKIAAFQRFGQCRLLRKRLLQPLRIQRFIDPAIPSGKRLLRTLQHLQ